MTVSSAAQTTGNDLVSPGVLILQATGWEASSCSRRPEVHSSEPSARGGAEGGTHLPETSVPHVKVESWMAKPKNIPHNDKIVTSYQRKDRPSE